MIQPKSLVLLHAPQTQEEFLRGFQDLLDYLLDPYGGAKHLRAAIPSHGDLFYSFLQETFEAITEGRHLITTSPSKIEDVIPAIADMLMPQIDILLENKNKDLHDKIPFYPPASFIDFLSSLIYFDSPDLRIQRASTQIVSFLEAANSPHRLSSETYRRMSLQKNIHYIARCIESSNLVEQATCLKMITGIWVGNKYTIDSNKVPALWIKDTIWKYDKLIKRTPLYLEALLVAHILNVHDIPWVWNTLVTQYKQAPSELHHLWHQGTDTTKALMVLYYVKNNKIHKRPNFSIMHLWNYINEAIVHILKNQYGEDYQSVVDFFKEEQEAVNAQIEPPPGPDAYKKKAVIEEAKITLAHALQVLK